MINFQYTALNPKTGRHVKANVQAANEQDAAGLIRKEALVPIEIKSLDQQGIKSSLSKLNRIDTKQKVLFSRQLSTLINAGLPIIQSLRRLKHRLIASLLKLLFKKSLGMLRADQH